jgi:hypothetical protein
MRMGYLGREIQESCLRSDSEGVGSVEEQLRWWNEGMLWEEQEDIT